MRIRILAPFDSASIDGVTRLWSKFIGSITLPFDPASVDFDLATCAVEALALVVPSFGASPRHDTASIYISGKLLDLTEDRQLLTLLHECLHVSLTFGAFRSRVIAIIDRRDFFDRDIRKRLFSGEITAERANLEEQRLLAALMFIKLPDEIAAEVRLRDDYADQLPTRAAYYQVIRAERLANAEALPPDFLRPWRFFYEYLTATFYERLADGLADVTGLHDIAALAAARFGSSAAADIAPTWLSSADTLLEITAAPPSPSAETVYESLFALVNGLG